MSDPHPSFRPDNLEHLRKQAKQLLRGALNGDATALSRFAQRSGNDVTWPPDVVAGAARGRS